MNPVSILRVPRILTAPLVKEKLRTRSTSRLMWGGRKNVTMRSKKRTGTPLRAEQIWKGHIWAQTHRTEEMCRPLGTEPGPHKQSLAQGGDYKWTGRHPKWKRFGKTHVGPEGEGMGAALSGPASSVSPWEGSHPEKAAGEQIQGHLFLTLLLADCAEIQH